MSRPLRAQGPRHFATPLIWAVRRLGQAVLYFEATEPEMNWRQYITSDPEVLHGAVCLGGTRISVSVVLDSLAANETPERILEQYPSLTPEHISAAIAYAADLARERIVPVPV